MNNSTMASPNDGGLCARSAIDKSPSSGYYFAASVVVGCVIMLENLLVFVAVLKTKTLRKPSYLYMASLALADFLAGLQIAIAFRKRSDYDNKSEMELIQALFLTSVGVSVLALLLLSINRYHVIVHPFHYRVNMNNRIATVAIVTSWVYATVTSFSPLMGWNSAKDCSPVYPGLTKSFVFFASLHVLVVLLVTLVLYLLIFIKVRQSFMQFKKGSRSIEERTHWKVAKTLAIVTTAFAVCYIPLMVMGLLDVARAVHYTKFMPFFTLLAVINSGLNPVIYAFRDKDLRRELKALACPCLQKPDAPTRHQTSSSPSTCFTACVTSREKNITPYGTKGGRDGENGKFNDENDEEGKDVDGCTDRSDIKTDE